MKYSANTYSLSALAYDLTLSLNIQTDGKFSNHFKIYGGSNKNTATVTVLLNRMFVLYLYLLLYTLQYTVCAISML